MALRPELPRLEGQTVVIIGGGPSVTPEALEHVRQAHATGRCRVIVINRAWEHAPWADWLHGQDRDYWERFPDALEFAGVKTTAQEPVSHEVLRIPVEDRGPPFRNPERPVHRGRDSGYQALQLAVLGGAARVLLLGFDAHGTGHFHGGYGPRRRATPAAHLHRIDLHRILAPLIAKRGCEVINCTPGSRIKVYPTAALEEVL